ncbi:DUF4405 domain-containing protein [Maribacter sp. ANRC-HE7]|uniref:DUF4405 domain-containing protein n=1 Tax=Maribacter aquimaris TaxID=2737171 RepID=A0ABR7V3R5_9FLAO|nr:DUF4405 domain-containing protein [Maribacter aquimaris]MBD0778580.1 DUF4405 domain-containing protein [Maribacter aquimaris]
MKNNKRTNKQEMVKIQSKKKTSKVRVYVDILLFTLMVMVLIPQTTGVPIHEWASFILIIPFLLHLIINWNWIAANSKKLMGRQFKKTVFDYFFNWLLYLFMLVVTVSGIVISEAALPVFGIHFSPDGFWSVIHDVSATLFMAMLGVHIALHWRWIVGALGKLKFKTDFHHVSEVGTILKKDARQLLILVGISVILSLVIWGFGYSTWADSFRIGSDVQNGENGGKMPMGWMVYVLPLLKVSVLMGIPALITGAILKLKRRKASIA